MSLWTLVKIVAGLVVVAVVVFTMMMVHHVRKEPLGGVFDEMVPVVAQTTPVVALPEVSGDLPEIDPGAKVFEKAREMIATGDMGGARDKLRTVVSIYPRSKAAPESRRILGEMNMDELLSAGHMGGKSIYEVKRGDYPLGIASAQKMSLDLMMHLNGLMDLKSLHPGDELVVMPLNLKFLVEPEKKVLSLWEGERFVKEYPLLEVAGLPARETKTTIDGKVGVLGDKRFSTSSAGYRGAMKQLSLKKPPLLIGVMPEEVNEDEGGLAPGVYLSAEDLEELSLLARRGNEVEIRPAAR